MLWHGRSRLRAVAGLAALVLAAVLLAALPLVPLAALAGPAIANALGLGIVPGPAAGLAVAVVAGPLASALAGPVLVGRRLDRLHAADLDEGDAEAHRERVAAMAAEVGVDAPDLRIVRSDAANVAVADGYRGGTLVVTDRLLSLPAADRDAAIRHGLVRLAARDAALATALLPTAVAVETLALVATLLVRRRRDRDESDRRVNRIHGYEPERDRVPAVAYVVAGAVLWLVLLPVWIPCALGERLAVAGGRRAADAGVARAGDAEREGLANAIEFARDAAGAGDWPPLLDRLSLVPMADEETRGVRGTSRQEVRVRLARLRSKARL